MKIKSGKKTQIHSYKHNGTLHRVWLNVFIIEETTDCLITGNYQTKVIEENGRSWYTKEPAICYFYKKEWFNVIAMIKKDGIHYYCNLSSPYVIDQEAIKYIDYDLDFKVLPSWKILSLDQIEYEENSLKMDYPQTIKDIIKTSSDQLNARIVNKESPFIKEVVLNDYEKFKTILGKRKIYIKENKKP